MMTIEPWMVRTALVFLGLTIVNAVLYRVAIARERRQRVQRGSLGRQDHKRGEATASELSAPRASELASREDRVA
jgi:hypothetical protein